MPGLIGLAQRCWTSENSFTEKSAFFESKTAIFVLYPMWGKLSIGWQLVYKWLQKSYFEEIICKVCKRKVIPAGNTLASVAILHNTARKASDPEIFLDMVKFLKDQGVSFTCRINDPMFKTASTVEDGLFEGFQDPKCSFYQGKLRKSIKTLKRSLQ